MAMEISTIGPEGGCMDFDDCYIKIPKGAFDEPVQFKMKLQGDCTLFCPEEYVGITPVLSSSTPIKSKLPLTIRLKTWCYTDHEDIIAYTACIENDDSGIKTINQQVLKQNGNYFTIKVQSFTHLFVYVKTIFAGKVEFKMKPQIFYNVRGRFKVIFHFNDATVMRELWSDMERLEFQKCPIVLNTMLIKQGSQISVRMRAESYEVVGNYTFTPVNQNGFIIDDDFVAGRRKVIEFQISPMPQSQDLLNVQFDLNQDGKSECFGFNLGWPELGIMEEID